VTELVKVTKNVTKVVKVFQGPNNRVRVTTGPAVRLPTNIPVAYTKVGTLGPQTGVNRFRAEYDTTAVKVSISVVTAPLGSDIVCDVLNEGVSIFSSPALRPRILAGQLEGFAVPDVGFIAAGHHITLDIVSVGSGQPGNTLTAIIWLSN